MKKSVKILALVVMVFAALFSVNYAAGFNVQRAYAAVIKQGSKGTTVKTIQQKLISSISIYIQISVLGYSNRKPYLYAISSFHRHSDLWFFQGIYWLPPQYTFLDLAWLLTRLSIVSP